MKKYLLKTFIIISVLLAGYSYFIEPNKLEVTNYTIQNKELDGVKIVFASDFHIKPYGQKRLEKIVKTINMQNPDIVVSTGDFVCGHTKKSTMHPKKIAEGLSKIKSKHGFYTTLGNHDGWYDAEYITKLLENAGIKVLNNKNVKLNINNKEIYIAGVEDMTTGRPNVYKALYDTGFTTEDDKKQTPIIMLTHTPDMFPKIPNKINLTLAGHTHGGQVRIPIIGAVFTASKYGNKYVNGLFEENHKKLITTRGIGVSILPFRLNCPPEIVVIEFTE